MLTLTASTPNIYDIKFVIGNKDRFILAEARYLCLKLRLVETVSSRLGKADI